MTTAADNGRDDLKTLFATPSIVRRPPRRRRILAAIERAAWRQRALASGLREHWARQTPTDLSRRAGEPDARGDGHYKEALAAVRSAAAWILAQGISENIAGHPQRNSVDHALFALARMMRACHPAAISPAYSLMSRD